MPKCSLFVQATGRTSITKETMEKIAMKDARPTQENNHPSLRFDWQDWLPYLDDDDVPEDKKRELIETLWSIVLAFVDLGWDIKSGAESCGEAFDLHSALASGMVDLNEDQKAVMEASREKE